MKIVIRFLSITMAIFLVSCSKNVIDMIFTYHESCHLPCWSGITPGITTESDAIILLSTNSLVKGIGDSYQSTNNSTYRYIETKKPLNEIEIMMQDDIVISTYLYFNPVTFKNIINKIGYPEEIAIGRTDFGDYVQNHFFAIYYEKGVAVHLLLKGTQEEIYNDTSVVGIIITDGEKLTDVIRNYNNEVPIVTRSWSGFGNYNNK